MSVIKRLRCVIYLDDRIPEEADILDFFNLGGARRLRSEAFRRLLLSGWMAANQTHALNDNHRNVPIRADRKAAASRTVAVNDDGSSGDKLSDVPTFNRNMDGLLYGNETSTHAFSKASTHTPPTQQSGDGSDDFFGKLF